VIRRALTRGLVVIGLVHVLDAVLLLWLWRHRVAVVRALAAAAGEEVRRRGSCAGEVPHEPRAASSPSAAAGSNGAGA
jgi:hypothetical protein